MPAIVPDDIAILPRIPTPDPAIARERTVRSVTTAPHGFEGEGFPVRRAFAGVALEDPTRSSISTRWVRSSTPQARRKARRGTRIAGSRP